MTNINLLPAIVGVATTSQDGDCRLAIAFQNSGTPIDVTGIAFSLCVKPLGANNLPVQNQVAFVASTSGSYLTNGGASGIVSLAVVSTVMSGMAPGTYQGDLKAVADGETVVVGSFTFNHSAMGACLWTSFTSTPRNAATANSVGYIPGPAWSQYKGNWSNTAAYVENDVVFFSFSTWIALGSSTGQAPAAGSTFWNLVAPGVDPTALNTATSEAQASASAASTAATSASESATEAEAEATSAAGSATSAGTSATNAGNSATAAGASATAAATSATNAGNSATAAALSALQAAAAAALRGYLAGLTLSSISTTTFGIAAGVATSDDNTIFMALVAATTKTTGAWAVGSGKGALDTGSVAINTWYHVYLIENSSATIVDVLMSLSATAPTMPSGYTKKRRIGSIKTDGSGNILAFTQIGDRFLWSGPPQDVPGITTPTAITLQTLSVPPGISVTAILACAWTAGSISDFLCIWYPGQSKPNWNMSGDTFTQMDIQTNTSSQVNLQASVAAGSFYVDTVGWTDTRGRFN